MYKIDEFNKCKKRFKLGIIFSIILFVLMIASLIIIGFNVNDTNSVILLVISLLIMLITGFVIIYIIIEFIYLSKIRFTFIKLINNASKKVITGVVVSCDKKATTSKYCTSSLIEVKTEKDGIFTIYSEEEINLTNNQLYEFKVGNNYIIDFKEVAK